MADEQYVISQAREFVGGSAGQATGSDYRRVRAEFACLANGLATFGRRRACNAAGVYHDQVRLGTDINVLQVKLLEQLSGLLGFVLIDLAAQRAGGKSFHNVV